MCLKRVSIASAHRGQKCSLPSRRQLRRRITASGPCGQQQPWHCLQGQESLAAVLENCDWLLLLRKAVRLAFWAPAAEAALCAAPPAVRVASSSRHTASRVRMRSAALAAAGGAVAALAAAVAEPASSGDAAARHPRTTLQQGLSSFEHRGCWSVAADATLQLRGTPNPERQDACLWHQHQSPSLQAPCVCFEYSETGRMQAHTVSRQRQHKLPCVSRVFDM